MGHQADLRTLRSGDSRNLLNPAAHFLHPIVDVGEPFCFVKV
jgi:hypothetical protein